ncbi:hypothetical protein IBX73_07290 [candidate division WOR-3 bacterium]|nr:hypothetical protein [candidate division WOR-3 bacterium]
MTIDRQHLDKIKQKIADEYPEFKDIEPQISEKRIKPQESVYEKLDMGVPKQFINVYRLRFERTVTTTDKVPIERILLVTLDENFEIIKIAESR